MMETVYTIRNDWIRHETDEELIIIKEKKNADIKRRNRNTLCQDFGIG